LKASHITYMYVVNFSIRRVQIFLQLIKIALN
jgi:hypothetical protein